jgi:hypothetical protein
MGSIEGLDLVSVYTALFSSRSTWASEIDGAYINLSDTNILKVDL